MSFITGTYCNRYCLVVNVIECVSVIQVKLILCVCVLSLAGITSLTLWFYWISSYLKLLTLPETSMRSPCSYYRSVEISKLFSVRKPRVYSWVNKIVCLYIRSWSPNCSVMLINWRSSVPMGSCLQPPLSLTCTQCPTTSSVKNWHGPTLNSRFPSSQVHTLPLKRLGSIRFVMFLKWRLLFLSRLN